MDTNAIDLQKLQEQALTVAAQHEEYTAALTAEQQAEAALLDATVEAIRPALRALASKIRTGYRSWWIGTTDIDSRSEYSDTRGLYVGDGTAGPGRSNPGRDENRGAHAGYDLFVTTDGKWLELEYSGHWSRWQGEGDEWSATERQLTSAEVAREYNVPQILGAIQSALERQLQGEKPKRTAAARERAERVAALVTLL